MILSDTRKLVIVLGSAKTTLDLPFTVDYLKESPPALSVRAWYPDYTNGTTPVTLLPADNSSGTRQTIKEILIYGRDTATSNVQIYLIDTASLTAGNFITGRTYQITAIGSTNFTLIGAAANTVGLIFTATGVGTGTGIASPAIQQIDTTINIDDVLGYTEANGWYCMDVNGNTKTIATSSAQSIANSIHAATAKTTPANADEFGFWDSVSNALNKITWANILATFQSFFDTRYASAFFSFTSSVAANALTGTLTTCKLDFRNATLATGTPINAVLAAPISLTVPSGATLGTANGMAARLVWLVAYNAGTPVLCVTNLAGGLNLDETTLISPTTISGTSNSAGVIYSASAVGANSPFRVIGFIDVTEAAAGTWATAPSTVQPAGGLSLAALGGFGYGQTWQNLAGSRALGTTYFAPPGKMIEVEVSGIPSTTTGGQVVITIVQNGVTTTHNGNLGVATGSGYVSMAAHIPPGASYTVTYSLAGGLNSIIWNELR